MKHIYTISGATGNIGHRIAESLLIQGHEVRVIGRSAERLEKLESLGARVFVGDLEDTDFLTRAYQGADGVFAMIPPSFVTDDYRTFQNRVAESHYQAIREAGVNYVLALSSIGGHLEEGAGVVLGLHDFEEKLKGLENTHVLVLRPGYFMENTYGQVEMIRNMGVATSPVAPDIKLPLVATRDIGDVAADFLTSLDFEGYEVRYVLGQRDLSYAEITGILGRAIGKENLEYVQATADQAREGLTQMGMSTDVADLIVGLSEGINSGRVQSNAVRTPGNTTPTSFEEFAESFRTAYQATA